MHIWLNRVLRLICRKQYFILSFQNSFDLLSNLSELLGIHQVLQVSCCHFQVLLLEIEMSRFPIASGLSCSVLSITGDTAKYLDFIIFCRSSTLYPHVTISSFCHQWPLVWCSPRWSTGRLRMWRSLSIGSSHNASLSSGTNVGFQVPSFQSTWKQIHGSSTM